MNERLLVLNAGSSSLKFAIYERVPEMPLVLKGSVSRLGSQEPRLAIRTQSGEERAVADVVLECVGVA